MSLHDEIAFAIDQARQLRVMSKPEHETHAIDLVIDAVAGLHNGMQQITSIIMTSRRQPYEHVGGGGGAPGAPVGIASGTNGGVGGNAGGAGGWGGSAIGGAAPNSNPTTIGNAINVTTSGEEAIYRARYLIQFFEREHTALAAVDREFLIGLLQDWLKR